MAVEQNATLEEIVIGPARENDGTLNLMGALRTSMATCGYESIHDFQKAEVMLAPSIKTEGKSLQQAQRIGMGCWGRSSRCPRRSHLLKTGRCWCSTAAASTRS